jgi:nucleoside-diphosphate-sugar epimerase
MTPTARHRIVERIRSVAPPGQDRLRPASVTALRALTLELAATLADAPAEFDSFTTARSRTLALDRGPLERTIQGRVVAVVGGTGCIGSKLVDELERLGPAQLVSISRGVTAPERINPAVDYRLADVRDPAALDRVVEAYKPDLVFHVAAQRDPGLAEIEVARTVETNVLGTANVVDACERHGVETLVYASTGKALRPYTPEIYAASKRIAEAIVGTRRSAGTAMVRFTHVVDNSIVLARILAAERGVIRLHNDGIMFFIQSGLESAELLLLGAVEAGRHDRPALLAIRDLGAPARLTELAVGAMVRRSSEAAIYFSGFDAGYEETPYAGLYLPEINVDASVLLNVFEASRGPTSTCPANVDVVDVAYEGAAPASEMLARLAETCGEAEDVAVRAALDELIQDHLSRYLATQPPWLLERIASFTEPWRDAMPADHLVMDDALRNVLAGEAELPAVTA